jgi:beta-barrel assembly-enhancing protease
MKKLLTLIVIFIINSTSVLSQGIDFDNYLQLESKNPLPIEFLTTSTKKYYENQDSNSAKNKREKKKRNEFYLRSNFELDELLRSGSVLYNDYVSNYVKTVFIKIVDSAKIDKKNLSVFIVNSPIVNAFAADNGTIIVTMGLIARLDNEAQLAFILCHELSHIRKSHSMNVFINASKEKDAFKEINSNEFYLKTSHYSRSKEIEADIEGVKLYTKLGYSLSEINSTFEILRLSTIAQQIKGFDNSIFNVNEMQWPKNYYLDNVGEIDSLFNTTHNNDSLSSHPNILTRKDTIKKYIADLSVDEGKLFCVSKDEFLNAKKTARFEICRLNLLEQEYFTAIYNAYALQEDSSQSKYLSKIIGKAFYSIAIYYHNGLKKDIYHKKEKQQGEEKKISHFFKMLNAKEALNLAIQYNWTLKNKYSDDIEINKICNHLSELLTRDYLTTKNHIESVKQQDDTIANEFKSLSMQKLFLDSTFSNSLLRLTTEWELKKKKYTIKYSSVKYDKNGIVSTLSKEDKEAYLNQLYHYQNKNIIRINNEDINVKLVKNKKSDEIAFITPFFVQIDERKKIPVRYIASEKKSFAIYTSISDCASSANQQVRILSGNVFEESDVQKLNVLLCYKNYLEEFDANRNLDIIPTDYYRLKQISDTTGIKYLGLVGAVNIIAKEDAMLELILMSVLIWPLPFTIPKLLTPNYNSIYFCYQIDIENNYLNFSEVKYYPYKPTSDITYSSIFDFIIKMKAYQK